MDLKLMGEKRGIILITCMVILLAGCSENNLPASTAGECAGLEAYIEKISPLFQVWTLTFQDGKTISRAEMPGMLDVLRQVRGEIAAVPVPECAASDQADLLQGMDQVAAGYQALLDQKSDAEAQELFNQGLALLRKANRRFNILQ